MVFFFQTLKHDGMFVISLKGILGKVLNFDRGPDQLAINIL